MSYVEQTWQTGDTVTAEKLNHMEAGIAGAGGGGGAGFMLVTVIYDENEDTYVADKTYAEIAAHLDSGGYCALVSSSEMLHEYYALTSYYEDDEAIIFGQTTVYDGTGVGQMQFVFYSNGTIAFNNYGYPSN